MVYTQSKLQNNFWCNLDKVKINKNVTLPCSWQFFLQLIFSAPECFARQPKLK